jgi:F-type H+-transporting ATPase subunit b
MVALLALAAWQIAIAQPPGAPKAPPKGAQPVKPKAKGGQPKPLRAKPKGGQPNAKPKLPSGHPPIDPSKMDPRRREQLKQLLQQRQRQRQQQQQQGRATPPTPAKPKKPKAPRDEHGHCLGDGPDDRPKDINLFHGWLGTKHELGTKDEAWDKAVKPPSPKGSAEWWWWRVTPYPYRYDNHDDHCDRANQPVPLIANIINLFAMVFIIVRFGRKPIAEALKNRKRTIMTDFDKAADIKRSARDRLDDYEDQLDNLDDKLEQLREQYAAEGRHEETRTRDEAEAARKRMLADAAFRVSQEEKTARDQLSREALEAALTAAEALVKKTLTQADHDRIATEYLDEIGPALNAKTAADQGGTA